MTTPVPYATIVVFKYLRGKYSYAHVSDGTTEKHTGLDLSIERLSFTFPPPETGGQAGRHTPPFDNIYQLMISADLVPSTPYMGSD